MEPSLDTPGGEGKRWQSRATTEGELWGGVLRSQRRHSSSQDACGDEGHVGKNDGAADSKAQREKGGKGRSAPCCGFRRQVCVFVPSPNQWFPQHRVHAPVKSDERLAAVPVWRRAQACWTDITPGTCANELKIADASFYAPAGRVRGEEAGACYNLTSLEVQGPPFMEPIAAFAASKTITLGIALAVVTRGAADAVSGCNEREVGGVV